MLASGQVLQTSVDLLREGLGIASVFLEVEILVWNVGSITERLAKNDMKLILAFNYLENTCFHITFTHSKRRAYICAWIGTIQDCNARHSRTLSIPFNLPHGAASLNIVQSRNDMLLCTVQRKELKHIAQKLIAQSMESHHRSFEDEFEYGDD